MRYSKYTKSQLIEIVEIQEKLLDDKNRVLSLVPQCKIHGLCLPHIENWIHNQISNCSESGIGKLEKYRGGNVAQSYNILANKINEIIDILKP